MVPYQLFLTFLARVFSEFRVNYAFLLPPGQFSRLSTLQTTLFPTLAPASSFVNSSSSGSVVSTNTAFTLDKSLLQGLDGFHRADEEAHPLVLLLSRVLEYQIVSLALAPRRPLSLVVDGLRSIWNCGGDVWRAGIDALETPDSVVVFKFASCLLVLSVLCAVIFWSPQLRHLFEPCGGSVGSVVNHVSSTATLVWHNASALLRGSLGSPPTTQIPGFLQRVLQFLESSTARTRPIVESRSPVVYPPDGRRVHKRHFRRHVLSPILEELASTSPAVSCDALDTSKLRSEHGHSERQSVASSSGTTTFEPHLPAGRQAALMDLYGTCIDSDSSEELRSPAFYSSDAWRLSEDDPDALALVVWRGGEPCIPSIEEACVSQKAMMPHESQAKPVSFWEQQYHLHDILRKNDETQAALDLAANNFAPEWSKHIMQVKTRSPHFDASADVEHQIDRHRRVFTEPHFPSMPSLLGTNTGLQLLPAFQSLDSMVTYLELCLRQPDFGRILSPSTQELAEVGAGNVLLLASRAELRKSKSAGDVRRRRFGPKAFLVFSQRRAKSQPLPPVVSPASTGSTLSVLLRQSSSLHEMRVAPERSRRTSGPNGATNPCPPFCPIQSAANDSHEDGENLLAMPRLRQPPITPISRPSSRRLARHSFPLVASYDSHQQTRTDSRSGGGEQRDCNAGQQDAPRKQAHSAGLGTPAGIVQTSASARKALVAATVGAPALEPELTGTGGVGEAGEQVPAFVRRAWVRPSRPTALPSVLSMSLARPSVISTPVYRLHGLSGIAHRSPMWSLKPPVLSVGASAEAGDEYVLSSLAVAEMSTSGRIFDGDLLRPE